MSNAFKAPATVHGVVFGFCLLPRRDEELTLLLSHDTG